MAESYSPWRSPVTLSPSDLSSLATGEGAACPLLYPRDERALEDLDGIPLSTPPPDTQQLWQPNADAGTAGADANLAIGASGIAVAGEDQMRLQAWGTPAGTIVTFYGRILRDDGQIVPWQEQITTLANNVVTSRTWQPGRGILLNIAASVPADTSANGVITVKGELGRVASGAFVPHTLLLYDQVTGTRPASGAFGGGTGPGAETQAVNSAFAETYVAGGTTFSVTANIVVPAGRSTRIVRVEAFFNCTASGFEQTSFIVVTVAGVQILWLFPNRVLRSNEQGYVLGNLGSAFPLSISSFAVGTANEAYGVGLPESLWLGQDFSVTVLLSQSVAGDIVSDLYVVTESR